MAFVSTPQPDNLAPGRFPATSNNSIVPSIHLTNAVSLEGQCRLSEASERLCSGCHPPPLSLCQWSDALQDTICKDTMMADKTFRASPYATRSDAMTQLTGHFAKQVEADCWPLVGSMKIFHAMLNKLIRLLDFKTPEAAISCVGRSTSTWLTPALLSHPSIMSPAADA